MAINNVPVVQGYAIQQNQDQQQGFTNSNNVQSQAMIGGGEFDGYKGQAQPKKFNDLFFAFLFWTHLAIMAVLLPVSLGQGNGGGGNGGVGGIIYFCTVCAVFATGITTISFGFMMNFASQLVQLALYFQIGCAGAMAIMGIMSGNILMAGMSTLMFFFSICYAYMVRNRIPFAAANLTTALTAVRANLGLIVIAYIFLFMGFGYSIFWTTISNYVLQISSSYAFFMFLSFYWVQQVLSNTVHVTTSGVIGTWWFAPAEASSCCSPAINDSFCRATTYSFGSICFGSLLVAIIQALRATMNYLRNNEDAQIIVCLIDCILSCIQGIIEYINKWAYVYVGLYGYNYLDAGRNVISLFQNKGWTTVITDDLAENALFMMSVANALLTGLVGFIVGTMDQNIFANYGVDSPGGIGFVFGFLIGFVLASIMMSVVASAVNTSIVCFAEAPREFEVNHPQLSNEMRNAWRQAWPEECGNM